MSHDKCPSQEAVREWLALQQVVFSQHGFDANDFCTCTIMIHRETGQARIASELSVENTTQLFYDLAAQGSTRQLLDKVTRNISN